MISEFCFLVFIHFCSFVHFIFVYIHGLPDKLDLSHILEIEKSLTKRSSCSLGTVLLVIRSLRKSGVAAVYEVAL